MTEFGSRFWQHKLLFRDFLRSHPETAREYLLLKRELAAKYGADRERYEAYTDGKNEFVASVLMKALGAKGRS